MKIIDVPKDILRLTLNKWDGVVEFETRLTAPCAICKWYWKHPDWNGDEDCPIYNWCKLVTKYNDLEWNYNVEQFVKYLRSVCGN
jgi:hypothetical protein